METQGINEINLCHHLRRANSQQVLGTDTFGGSHSISGSFPDFSGLGLTTGGERSLDNMHSGIQGWAEPDGCVML